MIPLSDIDRRLLHFPIVTAFMIVVNLFVFVRELAKRGDFIMRHFWSSMCGKELLIFSALTIIVSASLDINLLLLFSILQQP
jgi:hypothetical protein